jgi:hypothetical protein
MTRLMFMALLAVGCSSKPPVAPGGGGGPTSEAPAAGAGTAAVASNPACDALRPKIEQLYRAEAQTREPKRVDAAVADNTTMVLNDCVKAPDKVAPCVQAAATVRDLEARCLAPLDDEGTEGEHARH